MNDPAAHGTGHRETANALRYSPAGSPPPLTAIARSGRIELRVIDCGPGIPEADRDRMFAPFQRPGDTDSTTGVGLWLAVSRGLTEAVRGTLQTRPDPWRRGAGLAPIRPPPGSRWLPRTDRPVSATAAMRLAGLPIEPVFEAAAGVSC